MQHNYLCAEWHEQAHNFCVCGLIKDAQAAERDRIAQGLNKIMPNQYAANLRVWLNMGAPA